MAINPILNQNYNISRTHELINKVEQLSVSLWTKALSVMLSFVLVGVIGMIYWSIRHVEKLDALGTLNQYISANHPSDVEGLRLLAKNNVEGAAERLLDNFKTQMAQEIQTLFPHTYNFQDCSFRYYLAMALHNRWGRDRLGKMVPNDVKIDAEKVKGLAYIFAKYKSIITEYKTIPIVSKLVIDSNWILEDCIWEKILKTPRIYRGNLHPEIYFFEGQIISRISAHQAISLRKAFSIEKTALEKILSYNPRRQEIIALTTNHKGYKEATYNAARQACRIDNDDQSLLIEHVIAQESYVPQSQN